ncbi:PLP-dependent aminotransferase family protein [Herbaspirillum sp. SJZ099]|uniref:aminotransferase-like domain-containing protein n=1 Tax=unclassified Herbaspirillum TaxID=2624150 RepID=UPI001173BD6C|nr:DNA-binding transcriptional MocR family regulator [Herbaspirillum sp. SJZ102]TQK13638.1 DNA-binding transcriptional MocR family regulator [Herbaspirillum sp. SJZ130]TQK15641.1 DNA-binding transcriptional MocR family regulator [Herbaspirillum sp. SJZ106]TWC71540.1 DNA-binding transcriptional MocR family regulator [Herbaspirillum sp. SJZ099]
MDTSLLIPDPTDTRPPLANATVSDPPDAAASRMPLYRKLAEHYQGAIQAGTLVAGDRMPSVRDLMRQHQVSLSTSLQTLRHMEEGGWLEARPRSGYFVRQPRRSAIRPVQEPKSLMAIDPAQYVGIHEKVSKYIALRQKCAPRIDLSGMTCAPELYAVDTLKQAAMRALRDHPELLTSAMPHNGNQGFRQAVARRALNAGMRIDADEVVVTHGCIEALNLALRAVAGPGDTIAVESPTYFGLLQALENLGMRALEIPTSPLTGISSEALELAVRTYGNIKAVVVVPNLQNPLGCIMPDANKDKLVRLCEELRLPLIEDDAYTELADGNVAPSTLKSRDRSGNVIYCVSLNKVLAPGMRLGWMNGGRWHERVMMLKFTHTRANEEWTQITAADFLASPAYDRHLRRLRELLKEQRERMAESIAAYFPEGTRMTVPSGGVGMWVELPSQVCSQRLFEQALVQGVGVSPGAIFSNSNRYGHFLRICCGHPFTRELDQALRQLGQIGHSLAA